MLCTAGISLALYTQEYFTFDEVKFSRVKLKFGGWKFKFRGWQHLIPFFQALLLSPVGGFIFNWWSRNHHHGHCTVQAFQSPSYQHNHIRLHFQVTVQAKDQNLDHCPIRQFRPGPQVNTPPEAPFLRPASAFSLDHLMIFCFPLPHPLHRTWEKKFPVSYLTSNFGLRVKLYNWVWEWPSLFPLFPCFFVYFLLWFSKLAIDQHAPLLAYVGYPGLYICISLELSMNFMDQPDIAKSCINVHCTCVTWGRLSKLGKTCKTESSLPGYLVIWREKIKKYIGETIKHWREICPAGGNFAYM